MFFYSSTVSAKRIVVSLFFCLIVFALFSNGRNRLLVKKNKNRRDALLYRNITIIIIVYTRARAQYIMRTARLSSHARCYFIMCTLVFPPIQTATPRRRSRYYTTRRVPNIIYCCGVRDPLADVPSLVPSNNLRTECTARFFFFCSASSSALIEIPN